MLLPMKTLTSGFIDYAGLFPPALLGLPQALSAYAEYLSHPQGSFLARFVLPLSKTEEAAQWLVENEAKFKAPIAFSILTSLSLEQASAQQATHTFWQTQMAGIEKFLKAAKGLAKVETLEFAIPLEIAGDTKALLVVLGSLESNLHPALRARHEQGQGCAFVELPWALGGAKQEEFLTAVTKAPCVGLKLRTGGVKPEQVPPVEQLAAAIFLSATLEIKTKCTAGLHLPFRHFDTAVGANVFGFLNVFLSCIGARYSGLSLQQTQDLLMIENSGDVVLSANAMEMAKVVFTATQLAEGRKNAMLSFGSCSFLEPVEALDALGFLQD